MLHRVDDTEEVLAVTSGGGGGDGGRWWARFLLVVDVHVIMQFLVFFVPVIKQRQVLAVLAVLRPITVNVPQFHVRGFSRL